MYLNKDLNETLLTLLINNVLLHHNLHIIILVL